MAHRPVAATADRVLLAGLLIVALTAGTFAVRSDRSSTATPARGAEFPLAPGTRWAYHLRQEIGPGVTFGIGGSLAVSGSSRWTR